MIILWFDIFVVKLHKEDKSMTKSMPNRISQLLSEQNMSQKELAQKCEITESAISRYVSGDRVPRGVNLKKIANALGTTTDDLLDQKNEKDTEMKVVRTLIARNAEMMTKEEKMELIKILFNDD